MNTKDIALQESNNNIKSTPVKAQYISPKEERKKKDDSWETKFVMEPAFLDEKKAAFPSRAMKHAKTISLDIMESDIEEELKVSEDVDENYDEMRLQWSAKVIKTNMYKKSITCSREKNNPFMNKPCFSSDVFPQTPFIEIPR